MAHFVRLDSITNKVLLVNVISDSDCLDENGNESESAGISFCKSLWAGEDNDWKQTSYNGTIRKNFGAVGHTYDETRDAFIPPQPYNSWILNESTCLWESPVDYPQDGEVYRWDEETTSWVGY